MKHEVNRHVSTEEKHLWDRFKAALDRSEFEKLSVTRVAVNEVGVHQTRSRQLVSTWENEGLVYSGSMDSYDEAALTEKGRQVDEIVSVQTSGESWRDS